MSTKRAHKKLKKNNVTRIIGLAVLAMASVWAQPAHLVQAQQLITGLASNPNNINIYGSTSTDPQNGTSAHIDWVGSPRTAISECSTFLTLLMEQSYGYTKTAFRARTGGYSPNAAKYYDNILAGNSFLQLSAPMNLMPGDIMAVKYPIGSESSGHVMVIESVGAWQPRAASGQTFLQGTAYPEITGFYDITVIDSSASFHGPTDTRALKPGGIGRGVARLFVDANLNFTGYTWSTVANGSGYESAETTKKLTAFGRWIP